MVGELYKLCNLYAIGAMAFICNGSRHLVGKSVEEYCGDDGCENDGSNGDGNDEAGATVAPRSASVDVGMACSAMVPRVTAATRHLGSLAKNSSDVNITRCPGL